MIVLFSTIYTTPLALGFQARMRAVALVSLSICMCVCFFSLPPPPLSLWFRRLSSKEQNRSAIASSRRPRVDSSPLGYRKALRARLLSRTILPARTRVLSLLWVSLSDSLCF